MRLIKIFVGWVWWPSLCKKPLYYWLSESTNVKIEELYIQPIQVSLHVSFVHAIINPLLFLLLHKHLRTSLLSILCCTCRWLLAGGTYNHTWWSIDIDIYGKAYPRRRCKDFLILQIPKTGTYFFCPFLQTAVNLTTLLSKMKLMGNIRKSFSGNDLLRRQQRIDNEISEKAIAKLNTTMGEVLSDI